jgi:hypothetical protein
MTSRPAWQRLWFPLHRYAPFKDSAHARDRPSLARAYVMTNAIVRVTRLLTIKLTSQWLSCLSECIGEMHSLRFANFR